MICVWSRKGGNMVGGRGSNRLQTRDWSGINSPHHQMWGARQSWHTRLARAGHWAQPCSPLPRCTYSWSSNALPPPGLFLRPTNVISCPVHLSPLTQLTCTVPYTGNEMKNKQTIPGLIKYTAWWRKTITIKAHLLQYGEVPGAQEKALIEDASDEAMSTILRDTGIKKKRARATV